MTVTITFEDDEIESIQKYWGGQIDGDGSSRATFKVVEATKPKFIPNVGDRILAYETSDFSRLLMSVEEGEIVVGVTERNVFTAWLGDGGDESLARVERDRYEISTHEFEVVQ